MIAIPNVDKQKSCRECKYSLYSDVWLMDYCPIVEEKINNMEEIRADCPIIEIVQCNECKYWHEGEWYNTCDKHIGNGFPSDYFCGDGKRRSE